MSPREELEEQLRRAREILSEAEQSPDVDPAEALQIRAWRRHEKELESDLATVREFEEGSAKIGVRIVIVDDHAVVRELLRFRLARETDFYEVVGESGSGKGAIEVCRQLKPDLLLLDLLLPGMDGADVLRVLRSEMPEMRVLIFSGATRSLLIAEAIQLGAAGFVSKLRPWQTMLNAVNLVAKGGQYFDPSVAHLVTHLPARAEWQTLTSREREVVQMIAESRTTREIALLMGISVKTADKHRIRLMEKLRLQDSAEVTRFAIAAGMVTLS